MLNGLQIYSFNFVYLHNHIPVTCIVIVIFTKRNRRYGETGLCQICWIQSSIFCQKAFEENISA